MEVDKHTFHPEPGSGRKCSPSLKVTAYLGLGSSVGDRREHLSRALHRLRLQGTVLSIKALSSVYESPHLGRQPGDEARYPAHLNLAAEISTSLPPLELLDLVQQIEDEGGRMRTDRWGPRTIDIDILFYGDVRLRSDRLTLPHPEICRRAFVVFPLAELNPGLVVEDGRSIQDLTVSDGNLSQRIKLCEQSLQ